MADCPTPGKQAHRYQIDAIRHALSLSKRCGYGIRCYLCPCGRWHVTRWQTNRKTRTP